MGFQPPPPPEQSWPQQPQSPPSHQQTQQAHQIFCPKCQGGNPVTAPYCMWCKQPLTPFTPGKMASHNVVGLVLFMVGLVVIVAAMSGQFVPVMQAWPFMSTQAAVDALMPGMCWAFLAFLFLVVPSLALMLSRR